MIKQFSQTLMAILTMLLFFLVIISCNDFGERVNNTPAANTSDNEKIEDNTYFPSSKTTSSFTCTGAIPANAERCSNSDQGLIENMPIILSNNCDLSIKCNYRCLPGYDLMKHSSGYLLCTESYYSAPSVISVKSDNAVDHSIATVVGSIAWALKVARANDEIKLISNSTYNIHNRLEINADGQTKKISIVGLGINSAQKIFFSTCNSCKNDTAIRIMAGGYSAVQPITLRGINVDANFLASTTVKSEGNSNIVIENSKFENSLYSAIHLRQGTNITLRENFVQNAGVAGNANDCSGSARGINTIPAAGIDVQRSINVSISENSIKRVRTAGIDIGASVDTSVLFNSLTCVGLGGLNYLNTGMAADGVTGYGHRSSSITGPRNWLIAGNSIVNSGNNGIHVSGENIRILVNTIRNIAHYGIAVSDQKSPPDCSFNIVVFGNDVSAATQYAGFNWTTYYLLNFYPASGVRDGVVTNNIEAGLVKFGKNSADGATLRAVYHHSTEVLPNPNYLSIENNRTCIP